MSQKVFHLFHLTILFTLSTSYLIIDDTSNENDVVYDGDHVFDLGMVFTEIIDVDFGEVSSFVMLWDYEMYLKEGGGMYNGCVLFVETPYTLKEIGVMMSLDVVAVVVGTSLPEGGQLSLNKGASARSLGWDRLMFQISYVQSDVLLFFQFLSDGGLANVTVTDENNVNPWEEFMGSVTLLIIQIGLCVYTFISIFLCCYKLYFAMLNAPKVKIWESLPKSVLLAELIVGILRLLYFSIDPVGIRMLTDSEMTVYLAQVTAPISIATTIGVLIHWNEITKRGNALYKKIKYAVIVFIISLCFFGIIVLAILPYLISATLLTNVMSFFYVLVCISLSIYIFITVPNIITAIKDHPEKKVMIEKTVFVTLSGVLTVLWCTPPFYFIVASIGYAHIWISVWFIWFYLLVSISLAQILVFASRSSKKSKSKVVHLSKSHHKDHVAE